MHRRILARLAPVLLICLLGNTVAATQPAAFADSTAMQALTLTPSMAQLSVAPGGTTQGSVTLLNDGPAPYQLQLYAAPYRVVGVNYDPSFSTLPNGPDASQWIHIGAASPLPVAGHGQANVSYTVSVPAGTAPGGYYAVIFAQTIAPKVNTGIAVSDRVGEVLYLTVTGPVTMGGEIINTSLPAISFATNLPVTLEVKNTGGVHFLTTAAVTASTLYRQTVFAASQQRYVLPQTTRQITMTWQRTPPIGIYRIERSATIDQQLQRLPDHWIIIIHPWVIACLLIGVALLGAWYARHSQHPTRRWRSGHDRRYR